MGTTLRYPYEVRDSKDYFYDMPDVKRAKGGTYVVRDIR